MSPLMPAAFFAAAATLPLPQSQEISAPASDDLAPLLQLEDRLHDADEILRRLPNAREMSGSGLSPGCSSAVTLSEIGLLGGRL